MLLTPEIYDILAHTKPGAGGEIQLTDAMAEYARNCGGMTAVEFTGTHYDMGQQAPRGGGLRWSWPCSTPRSVRPSAPT